MHHKKNFWTFPLPKLLAEIFNLLKQVLEMYLICVYQLCFKRKDLTKSVLFSSLKGWKCNSRKIILKFKKISAYIIKIVSEKWNHFCRRFYIFSIFSLPITWNQKWFSNVKLKKFLFFIKNFDFDAENLYLL